MAKINKALNILQCRRFCLSNMLRSLLACQCGHHRHQEVLTFFFFYFLLREIFPKTKGLERRSTIDIGADACIFDTVDIQTRVYCRGSRIERGRWEFSSVYSYLLLALVVAAIN